jgi:hypothetical protein
MSEHHTSRRARALKKDRTRQQQLRDRKKAAKSPSTHTVNRAIVYALMVEIKAQGGAGLKVVDADVSVANVLRGALAYLSKGTHAANSYSREAVHKALVDRFRRDAF